MNFVSSKKMFSSHMTIQQTLVNMLKSPNYLSTESNFVGGLNDK